MSGELISLPTGMTQKKSLILPSSDISKLKRSYKAALHSAKEGQGSQETVHTEEKRAVRMPNPRCGGVPPAPPHQQREGEPSTGERGPGGSRLKSCLEFTVKTQSC